MACLRAHQEEKGEGHGGKVAVHSQSAKGKGGCGKAPCESGKGGWKIKAKKGVANKDNNQEIDVTVLVKEQVLRKIVDTDFWQAGFDSADVKYLKSQLKKLDWQPVASLSGSRMRELACEILDIKDLKLDINEGGKVKRTPKEILIFWCRGQNPCSWNHASGIGRERETSM